MSLPSLFRRPSRSRALSRLSFDDLIEQISQGWSPFEGGIISDTFKVDVKQTDNEYVVKADLPGLKKENIHVTLDNQILTITAEEEKEEEEKDTNYLLRERYYSSSQRSVPLAYANTQDNVKAEYKNGVLEIHVKKSQEKQSKKIPVQ